VRVSQRGEAVMSSIYGLTYSIIHQGGNYLILHKGSSIQRTDIELESLQVLTSNNIFYVLNTSVDEVDVQIRFQYNITNKRPLIEVLRGRKITMNEYYQLLKRLIGICIENSHQMLSPVKYILRNEFIYTDSEGRDLFLAYLPLKEIQGKGTMAEELALLSNEWVQCVANLDSVGYQKILESLGSGAFSLESFNDLLEELIDEAQIPQAPRHLRPITDDIEQRNQKKGFFQQVFDRLRNRFTPMKKEKPSFTYSDATMRGNLQVWGNTTDGLARDAKPNLFGAKGVGNDTVMLSTLSVYNPDATMVLGGEQRPEVKLILHFTNGEKIAMQEGKLVIGRNPETADYVVNKTGVSRSHLEIISLGNGNFGIQDLGSKNGSSLNGVDMMANQMYTLKNGDIVRFANEEFTIKMGSSS